HKMIENGKLPVARKAVLTTAGRRKIPDLMPPEARETIKSIKQDPGSRHVYRVARGNKAAQGAKTFQEERIANYDVVTGQGRENALLLAVQGKLRKEVIQVLERDHFQAVPLTKEAYTPSDIAAMPRGITKPALDHRLKIKAAQALADEGKLMFSAQETDKIVNAVTIADIRKVTGGANKSVERGVKRLYRKAVFSIGRMNWVNLTAANDFIRRRKTTVSIEFLHYAIQQAYGDYVGFNFSRSWLFTICSDPTNYFRDDPAMREFFGFKKSLICKKIPAESKRISLENVNLLGEFIQLQLVLKNEGKPKQAVYSDNNVEVFTFYLTDVNSRCELVLPLEKPYVAAPDLKAAHQYLFLLSIMPLDESEFTATLERHRAAQEAVLNDPYCKLHNINSVEADIPSYLRPIDRICVNGGLLKEITAQGLLRAYLAEDEVDCILAARDVIGSATDLEALEPAARALNKLFQDPQARGILELYNEVLTPHVVSRIGGSTEVKAAQKMGIKVLPESHGYYPL
ncbi:MAG: hypothetical protein NTY47_02720, partial [Candidatus Omnitrophica bacterium]|nr:hypothetical protein [Candidatus Omnitrophota bacterium]